MNNMFFKIRITVSFVLLTLFTSFSLWANNLQKEATPGSAIRDYIMKNVMPVIREERNQLDEKLSAHEQEVIETARKQLKDLREENRASRRGVRGAGRPLTDEQREALKLGAEKRKEILTPVKAIADARLSDMQEINARLESKKEAWKQDIKVLREQNQNEDNRRHKRLDKGRRGMEHHDVFGRWNNPVNFLLMDPNQPVRPHRPQGSPGATVFPNPATHEVTLKYNTEHAGEVRIQVLDEGGDIVHQKETRESGGNHSYTLNVSDWKPGLYYYKIQTGEQEITKRFRVE